MKKVSKQNALLILMQLYSKTTLSIILIKKSLKKFKQYQPKLCKLFYKGRTVIYQ